MKSATKVLLQVLLIITPIRWAYELWDYE